MDRGKTYATKGGGCAKVAESMKIKILQPIDLIVTAKSAEVVWDKGTVKFTATKYNNLSRRWIPAKGS